MNEIASENLMYLEAITQLQGRQTPIFLEHTLRCHYIEIAINYYLGPQKLQTSFYNSCIL